MGINCCSNAKEPTDITITKPEKNMTSTSQNPLHQNNNVKVQNITEQIQDLKQSTDNSNSNIIVPNDLNTLNNSDINQNNNISPLTQKEIDEILNKANYDNQPQVEQKEIINVENKNIANNINNNVTPLEQKIKQNENIIIQNNDLDIDQLLNSQTQNNTQNNANIPKQEQNIVQQHNLNQNVPKKNINNIDNNKINNNINTIPKQNPNANANTYIQPNPNINQNAQNQNKKIITQTVQTTQNIPTQNPNLYIQNIQNIPKTQILNQNKGNINNYQKISNTQIIQHNQNINNDLLNPQTKTKIEDEIEKYFSSQQNQVINNAQNLNIEELLNNQNNQNTNQNKTEKINDNNQYIEDILKNTSLNQNVNNNINTNMNLDVFFTQGDDIKIDDALIDKLFESAGKPAVQSQVQKQNINVNSNQDPLYMSQKFNPNQNLTNLNNNNNYFSPINSPQRSEISEPGSFNYKQVYGLK